MSDQKHAERRFSDLKCERFLLNELDEGEMEEIRRAAENDPTLRARLDALAESNTEILNRYPAGWMADRVRGKIRAADSPPRRRPGRSALGVLVPAGVVAVVALAVFFGPRPMSDGESTRIKGPTPQLQVYRQTADGAERLADGDGAAAGDVVLLQYRSDEHAYGVILSVDGRGVVTRHLPEEGEAAAALEVGAARSPAHAYALDDAPGWEVFHFVTSASPFTVAFVQQAIAKSLPATRDGSGAYAEPPAILDLPDEYRVATFTLIKGR